MQLGEKYVEVYRSLVLLDFYFCFRRYRVTIDRNEKRDENIFKILDIFVEYNKINFSF